MSDRVPLTRIPRELAGLGYVSPRYERVWRAAVEGLIPADQVTTNRWSVARSDLIVTATALGLARQPASHLVPAAA